MSEREVVRRLLVDYIGECACDEAYTVRKLRDPQCNYHDVMLEDLLEDLLKLGAGHE